MNKKIIFYLSVFIVLLTNPSYADNPRLGATFSQVQCEYLGLEWRRTYSEVLEMGFDLIRLGAYWSRIEKNKGEFDFSELDWQIQKAKEKNTPILLTVGMKAPRWPEYFIPGWIEKDIKIKSGSSISNNAFIKERTRIFISEVVNRYKDENIIFAWQIENEPLSRAGPKDLRIRRNFLLEEIALVKKLDGNKRIIVVNAMTYPNGFLRFLTGFVYRKDPIYETIDIAQAPALDIYPAIGQKIAGKNICFWTDPRARVAYFKLFFDYAKKQNKSLWVTELQSEPWEPGELVHMGKEEAITCGAENFRPFFKELRSLGIDTVFFWGVEYWLYREHKYNDNTWINNFTKIAKEVR